MLPETARRDLGSLGRAHQPHKDALYRRTEDYRRELLEQVLVSWRNAVEETWRDVLRPDENLATRMLDDLLDYDARCQWVLFDPIALAACVARSDAVTSDTELADRLVDGLLLYQSFRLVDDVVDGHADYKGHYRTFYGDVLDRSDDATGRALTVLAAVLTLLEGSRRGHPAAVDLAQRTVGGMTLEVLATDGGDVYDRIVERKMVCYSRLLYDPVVTLFDRGVHGPLEDFLQASFRVSQLVNDLHDRSDDFGRQPNYWRSDPAGSTTVDAFLAEMSALSDRCVTLPEPVEPYGHARVADLVRYALEADASRTAATATTATSPAPATPPVDAAVPGTPSPDDVLRSHLSRHVNVLATLPDTAAEPFAAATQRVRECLRGGGALLVCGNGGSAADALHFAAELSAAPRPWRATALAANPSAMTATANDESFEQVFERQVEALGRPGDLLVALSTSGRSRNVVLAAEAAHRLGLGVLAFTGQEGGPLGDASDVVVKIPTTDTAIVQEGHGVLLHALWDVLIEDRA